MFSFLASCFVSFFPLLPIPSLTFLMIVLGASFYIGTPFRKAEDDARRRMCSLRMCIIWSPVL